MAKKSKFGVNVGSKSKIIVEWKDKPENYSFEAKNHIISIMSDRYKIPKGSIKVNFIPIKYNEKGELIDVSTDVINNIQDPKFQIKLFKDYINENSIIDVNFEFIKKIDSEINSKIDYDVYDKYRKYEIEFIEWDNFLSYGEGNYFDFRQLNGLTLVNGFPANQSGKSSFTIDLISFLLFGKSQKPYTLSECFNKYSNSKTFRVCGGLKIDGDHYVIDRIITRSKKRNGTWGDASQEVKYYQLINGVKEELKEEDKTRNENGEHSIKTNKIIKEAVGNEKDFNMIISSSGGDLDSLIEIGSTERGRLLSKWIGLFPLEEKDKIGKETFKEFERGLKSRNFNETDLTNENIELSNKNIKNDEVLNINILRINEIINNLETLNQEKETLLSSKKNIDNNILKLNIATIERKLSEIVRSGNLKKQELDLRTKEFEIVKNYNFSNEEYKDLLTKDKELSIELNNVKNDIKNLISTNDKLEKSEYCPTCHRKYEGADNSKIILENKEKIDVLNKNASNIQSKIDSLKAEISKMENDKIKYDQKLKLENIIAVLPVQIQNLRNDYTENSRLIKEYNDNKDSIDLNSKIDISLTNVNAKINSFNIEKNNKIIENENLKRNIQENTTKIEKNKIIISEIKEEMIKLKNWKIYLEMIGKNGISKMVLKKTLPIINAELSRILDDVCDFEVEVVLNEKNDVNFKLIKNDISSNLAGGSGYEKTAAALALRCVLGNISTMPKPNFITLDEILGRVAKENYDRMKTMYEKIQSNYQFILHICHIEDIKDWHKNIITINKTNDISSIIFKNNSSKR